MESDMKITAGLGMTDDFMALAESGVQEIFCGYVPNIWNQKYGNLMPLNRREVLFYHVQIGAIREMQILKKIADQYKVLIAVTFNALYYTQEQLPWIGNCMRELCQLGINDFIVADLGLLLYLKEEQIACNVHVSGEWGEWNTGALQVLLDTFDTPESTVNIKRIIFHRKNTISDMKRCTAYGKSRKKDMEFEAFFMNEMCHFTGGFCNSLHCDELLHMCQIPYDLAPVKEKSYDRIMEKWNAAQEKFDEEEMEVPGNTGCGLCALWELQQAGITHLKVVGRGKGVDGMAEDIACVNIAKKILKDSDSSAAYRRAMKKRLFPKGCSHTCYYYENVSKEGV